MARLGRRQPFKPIIKRGATAAAPRMADRPLVVSFAALAAARFARHDRIIPPIIKSKTPFTARAKIADKPLVVSFAAVRYDPRKSAYKPLYKIIKGRSVAPPFPVPSPFVGTADATLIARDPTAGRKLDPRLRRLTEIVSSLVNSLVGQGQIVQTGVESWTITQGAWSGARPPSVGDDSTKGIKPGTVWIDTSANAIYVNISATPGFAVWAGPFTNTGLTGTFP